MTAVEIALGNTGDVVRVYIQAISRPLIIENKPAAIWNSVDLPEPLGPATTQRVGFLAVI